MKKLKNLPKKMPSRKTLVIIAAFSVLFLAAYLMEGPRRPRFVGDAGEQSGIQFQGVPFKNIDLRAKSAYVFDVAKGEPIFEFSSGAQLPLASLTKIMTAIAAKENLPEWLKISIPVEAVLQEGDSGFLVGEQWKVKNLSDAMLISSSNDAAYALASSLYGQPEFVYLMNKKAKEMGLNQTYFLNSTGLDMNANIAGAYGSAKNVADMIAYGLKNYPLLFEVTSLSEEKITGRQFKNTNKLVNEIPRIIAGKTGFSDLAGGNLVVVADIGLNHPVIIVVIGSSERGRFDDVKILYEETLKHFQER